MQGSRTKLIFGMLMVAVLMPAASLADDAKPKEKPKNKFDYNESKDLGVKAPEGADILFDGTQESIDNNWQMWPIAEMAISWELVKSPTDDTMVMMTSGGKKWGTHDLVTKNKYRDFVLHLEFVLMGARGDGKPDGYANSGVYLQNRHELQIESPKNKRDIKNPRKWKIDNHGIGAFCMEYKPKHNAWRDPGNWQSYHIKFKAARWDKDGKKLADARATVWWNGVLIHDDVVLNYAKGGIAVGPEPAGLKLQEHGQDVRFRNIWIKPIESESP